MQGNPPSSEPASGDPLPPVGAPAETKPRSSAWFFLLFTFVVTITVPAILILPGLRTGPSGAAKTNAESRPKGESKPTQAVTIRPIEDQRVDELSPLTVVVQADAPADEDIEYRLIDPPEGAKINAVTGRLHWRPTEEQGPAETQCKVAVHSKAGRELAKATFLVTVNEVNQPPAIAPIEDQQVAQGQVVSLSVRATDPDLPAQNLEFTLMPGSPAGAWIDPASGQIAWKAPNATSGGSYRFEVRVTDSPGGDGATTSFDLIVAPVLAVADSARPSDDLTNNSDPAPVPGRDDPSSAKTKPDTGPSPKPAEDSKPPADDSVADAETPKTPDEQIVALFKSRVRKGNLLDREAYPKLRKIFADRFEQQQAAAIQTAYGADLDAMNSWLDEHVTIKEEFYTAIKPRYDNVEAALAMLNSVRKQFPEEVAIYPNVAIALAVTWDNRGQGVYDYEHHARRTKSDLPDGMVGAMENFQYLLELEKVTSKRVAYLPWEFVTLLVNHKTPIAERTWAAKNYVGRRQMFGRCYHDVPYDHRMLDTRSAEAELNGKPYTLPAIREFGGVCAMQADFAARVGKSIGVPAAYVRGPSAFGEHHAWVMWVELTGVSRSSIQFSLQSHGRYRGDKYYVGTLRDPQTGQQITDRQLELRLQAIGMDPIARRHADLIMQSYPMLREKTEMDAEQQLAFLNDVIKLSPGNEAAWKAVAQMSRDGQITGRFEDKMLGVLDALFRTFRNVPDFTWEIFDDLIAFQKVPSERFKLYARLAALYEAAERPDLSCEARLQFATYLVAEEQYSAAINGLAHTIMKFPEEGRYVPQMLDRLEAICDRAGGRDQELSNFYKVFLPKVPQTRNGRPSPYAIKMFNRAIRHFESRGDLKTAQVYEKQLEKIEAGKQKKKSAR